jgi:prepilin-type N-terminal cleavage/methylation domain-containing protein
MMQYPRMNLDDSLGFTLIEVLIAMTIFAVGILGVAAMQLTSVRGNTSAGNVTANTFIGEDRVETSDVRGIQLGDSGQRTPNVRDAGCSTASIMTSTAPPTKPGKPVPLPFPTSSRTIHPLLRSKTITYTVTRPHAFGQKTTTYYASHTGDHLKMKNYLKSIIAVEQ